MERRKRDMQSRIGKFVDNKWFTRLVVAAAIVEALENLDLGYPELDAAKRKELAEARVQLMREKD
jgi:hypothetical protein